MRNNKIIWQALAYFCKGLLLAIIIVLTATAVPLIVDIPTQDLIEHPNLKAFITQQGYSNKEIYIGKEDLLTDRALQSSSIFEESGNKELITEVEQ